MSQLSEEQLDTLVAAERAHDPLPLNDWPTIAARAREEGLILDPERSGWSGLRPWMQAAAAVLVLVGGIAIGRSTTGLPGTPDSAVAVNTDSGASNPSFATNQPVGGGDFPSVDAAAATLDRALSDYQRASAYLARANYDGAPPSDSSRMYTARLAALNEVGNAMESAIHTAPHDPVINQYYLATMGARVATQQLVARPVGLALKGF